MKLTAALVEQTLVQFEAEAIPENHPVVPELNRLFGEHTFFLDEDGLNIVEPLEAPEAEAGQEAGQVVRLADWSDAKRSSLVPHEPEPLDVVVLLARR
jgi:hypothetical protein